MALARQLKFFSGKDSSLTNNKKDERTHFKLSLQTLIAIGPDLIKGEERENVVGVLLSRFAKGKRDGHVVRKSALSFMAQLIKGSRAAKVMAEELNKLWKLAQNYDEQWNSELIVSQHIIRQISQSVMK